MDPCTPADDTPQPASHDRSVPSNDNDPPSPSAALLRKRTTRPALPLLRLRFVPRACRVSSQHRSSSTIPPLLKPGTRPMPSGAAGRRYCRRVRYASSLEVPRPLADIEAPQLGARRIASPGMMRIAESTSLSRPFYCSSHSATEHSPDNDCRSFWANRGRRRIQSLRPCTSIAERYPCREATYLAMPRNRTSLGDHGFCLLYVSWIFPGSF
jgi:hypothetical protein